MSLWTMLPVFSLSVQTFYKNIVYIKTNSPFSKYVDSEKGKPKT